MKAVRANNQHLTDSQTEAAETLQQIFFASNLSNFPAGEKKVVPKVSH